MEVQLPGLGFLHVHLKVDQIIGNAVHLPVNATTLEERERVYCIFTLVHFAAGEHVTFFNIDLATNHFVARNVVASNVDTAHTHLAATLDIERDINLLFNFVGNHLWVHIGVNVAFVPIQAADFFNRMNQFGMRVWLALFKEDLWQ